MANKVFGASVGAITDVHSSQKNPLGMEVMADDGSVYIYLAGGTSIAANSWVSFDELMVATLLAADAVGRVAIAQAAVDASTKFGWFCVVSGNAGVTGKCDTLSADTPIYIDGTAGRVDDASVAGDAIFNAIARSDSSSNLATFQITRPFVMNGGYLV